MCGGVRCVGSGTPLRAHRCTPGHMGAAQVTGLGGGWESVPYPVRSSLASCVLDLVTLTGRSAGEWCHRLPTGRQVSGLLVLRSAFSGFSGYVRLVELGIPTGVQCAACVERGA
eukprot:7387561-Prymnesium_polylepis.2